MKKTLFVVGITVMVLGALLVAASGTIGVGIIVLSQAQGGLELLPVSYFGGMTIAEFLPGPFVGGVLLALVGWKIAEIADEEDPRSSSRGSVREGSRNA